MTFLKFGNKNWWSIDAFDASLEAVFLFIKANDERYMDLLFDF